MAKRKRFFIIYASVFSLIWIGYGLYAVISRQSNAGLILGIAIAFAVVMTLATWFSYWLMGHYKQIDNLAKEIISPSKKSKH